MDHFPVNKTYRSRTVVCGPERAGHRALLRSLGLSSGDFEKPFVGIVNSWNEMHPGHVHLKGLAEEVKAEVLEAGAVPFEFNAIAICDGVTQGHAGMRYVLPSRDLIADSIELVVEAQQLDGLVFLCSCDKIGPAMLMALETRKAGTKVKQKEITSPVLRRYVKLVGNVSEGATLTNF